jgi:NAD-dependent deacetylase
MSNAESHNSILVLSGAGLSAASGVPTFRDKDGLWEGYEITQVATPSAWFADRDLVRRFYSERRLACGQVKPNEGHYALARLQDALGVDQVALITQNIDGLLQKAGCLEVIEMHGSLWRLRCEDNPRHPTVSFEGAQDGSESCEHCGAALRPDVVWFGEMPYFMDQIGQALARCGTFISVGTSGVVYPAAGFVAQASAMGSLCIEVNPAPAGGPFHRVITEPSETALPRLVEGWLSQTDES